MTPIQAFHPCSGPTLMAQADNTRSRKSREITIYICFHHKNTVVMTAHHFNFNIILAFFCSVILLILNNV